MRVYLSIIVILLVSSCAPHAKQVHKNPFQPANADVKEKGDHAEADASQISKEALQAILQDKSDEFLYMASKAAMADRNYPLALSFLKTLSARSTELTPQLELARLYLLAKKPAGAEELLQPFLQKFPMDVSLKKISDETMLLHQLYARALLEQGKATQALAYLQSMLDAHPAMDEARIRLIQGYMAQKQLDKAEVQLVAGLARKETTVLLHLQVELALRQENIKKARRTIRHLRTLQPDDEQVVILYSEIELQANNNKRAERILRDFFKAHPSSLRIGNQLGKILIHQQRGDEAVVVYQNLLQIGTAVPEILSTLGMLYYEQKEYVKAAKAFADGLELQPENDTFHFYLAVNKDLLNQFDLAKQHYARVTEKNPRYALSQLRVAVIEMNQDQIDAAESILLSLLKKKPAFTDGWALISALYLEKKEYQLLLDRTEKALQLKEIPDSLLLNRAIAQDHFKRYAKIEQTIKQLLQQSPDNPEALNFMGYSLAERGERLAEAETYVRKALKQKPDNGYYLDSLAWIHYQQGDYPEAILIQRKALTLVGAVDPIMHEHLGDMLWRQGDQQAAKEAWQNALDDKNSINKKILQQKLKSGL